MIIGLFADTHDHLDNIRRSVAEFNRRNCELEWRGPSDH